jgi:hypothetical protein
MAWATIILLIILLVYDFNGHNHYLSRQKTSQAVEVKDMLGPALLQPGLYRVG